jgi:AcrR family transcriptional regulator
MAMSDKAGKSPRVTRNDWLQVAIALLADEGFNAISVDALATRLGITRGSFYHHFKDRQDLTHEMLTYWKNRWTTEIRNDVAALDLDGYQALRALGRLITHRQAAEYDVAVRSWALHDDFVATAVAEVDALRLEFIQKQFEKLGFEGLELENRSRLYLYYAMTEPAFFAPPDSESTEQLAKIRLDFLTT